nr:ribosome-associated heat shock protein Hsp15 [Yersinia pseudotuberculosis]
MKDKISPAESVRLDKWLWAARFYKTRAIARDMVDGGKVHYNGQRSKPSKLVELHAEIRLRQGNDERTVRVLALHSQRRGAEEAQTLYEETEASLSKLYRFQHAGRRQTKDKSVGSRLERCLQPGESRT